MNTATKAAVSGFLSAMNKYYEANRQVCFDAVVEQVRRDDDGQVTGVLARVQGQSGIPIQVAPSTPGLAAGAMMVVENLGTIGAPVWSARGGILGGTVAVPRVLEFPEGYDVGGGAYAGGDLILGRIGVINPATGAITKKLPNFFYDDSEGTFQGRFGTDVTLGLNAITGAAHFGPLTGAHVLVGTSGLRIKTGSTERIGLNVDGSGFLANNHITWDAAGNLAITGGADVTISGAINADSGTIGALTVDDVLTVGTGGSIKSANYVAGSTGWQVDNSGSAEFANVLVRGEIKAAVFTKAMVSAFAGSQIVAKSASVLAVDLVVDNNLMVGEHVAIRVKAQNGAAPFADGDILRVMNGGNSSWFTATWVSESNGVHYYNSAYEAGTRGVTYRAGEAVVDYGQSGQGYYIVSADGLLGASAAWALRSHAGAPWTTETTHVYAGTDGRLYAGGGAVALDVNGVSIISPVNSWATALQWSAAGHLRASMDSYYDTDSSYIRLRASYDGIYAGPTLGMAARNDGTGSSFFLSGGGGSVSSNSSDFKLNLYGSQGIVLNDGVIDLLTAINNSGSVVTAHGTLNVASTLKVGDGTAGHIGDIGYSGNLHPRRGTTEYTGYVYWPLATPTVVYNGTQLNIGTVNIAASSLGIPTVAKAVKVRLAAVWGTAANTSIVSLCKRGTTVSEVQVRALVANFSNDNSGDITCDANGDIALIVAGANTLAVSLTVTGYYV